MRLTADAVVERPVDGQPAFAARSPTKPSCRTADLTPFIEQAVVVGTMAIAGAGGIQETANVHRLIDDLERRTDAATKDASAATQKAVTDAAAALKAATGEARTGFEDAAGTTRKSIKQTVDEASAALNTEIRRLIGADNPELLTKLAPVLDRFGNDLDARARKQTEELIVKVARQFDADDPTSPMSKQTRELEKSQQVLAESLGKSQQAIEAKLAELANEIAVQTASRAASAIGVTTAKGGTYEERVNGLMDQIAAGLGDAYLPVGASVGKGSTGKKGDGVLTVDGGQVRIVLEMTDSARKDWNGYLAEAEHTRSAIASIGIARTPEQLGGDTLRSFGPRRIVLASGPETDDRNLLRTIVQVVRTSAIAASRRQDTEEIATAQECVDEAISLLDKFNAIKRTAAVITNNAEKIDGDTDSLAADLTSVLARAQRALVQGIGDHGHEAA